jgi:hypothetical protein
MSPPSCLRQIHRKRKKERGPRCDDGEARSGGGGGGSVRGVRDVPFFLSRGPALTLSRKNFDLIYI